MRVLAGVVAHEIAAVVRTEGPRVLELDEAVELVVRQSPLAAFSAALSANFDGPALTTGSSISLRRSTSLIHCSGLSVALICLACLAFVPYSGWKPTWMWSSWS